MIDERWKTLDRSQMNPEKGIEPVEGRSEAKRYLKIAGGLLRAVLGMIYPPKKAATSVQVNSFVSLQKEINSVGRVTVPSALPS